jgi:hypothetical protein
MMTTMKTAEERIAFPSGYIGMQKEIAVYSYSGRLIAKAVFEKQSVSLRHDFGISTGLYIVKVRVME